MGVGPIQLLYLKQRVAYLYLDVGIADIMMIYGVYEHAASDISIHGWLKLVS